MSKAIYLLIACLVFSAGGLAEEISDHEDDQPLDDNALDLDQIDMFADDSETNLIEDSDDSGEGSDGGGDNGNDSGDNGSGSGDNNSGSGDNSSGSGDNSNGTNGNGGNGSGAGASSGNQTQQSGEDDEDQLIDDIDDVELEQDNEKRVVRTMCRTKTVDCSPRGPIRRCLAVPDRRYTVVSVQPSIIPRRPCLYYNYGKSGRHNIYTKYLKGGPRCAGLFKSTFKVRSCRKYVSRSPPIQQSPTRGTRYYCRKAYTRRQICTCRVVRRCSRRRVRGNWRHVCRSVCIRKLCKVSIPRDSRITSVKPNSRCSRRSFGRVARRGYQYIYTTSRYCRSFRVYYVRIYKKSARRCPNSRCVRRGTRYYCTKRG